MVEPLLVTGASRNIRCCNKTLYGMTHKKYDSRSILFSLPGAGNRKEETEKLPFPQGTSNWLGNRIHGVAVVVVLKQLELSGTTSVLYIIQYKIESELKKG